MIVFDVDGTLIGGEPTDWASFEEAFAEVAGFALDEAFFDRIEEVTAQAIVDQALPSLAPAERRRMEAAICQGYLQRLQAAHATDGDAFRATAGAVTLLQALRARKIPVAIATGDWRETNAFKLRAAGIPFEGLPRVTSSDFYSRAEIIAEAIARAGSSLAKALYVGDGLWDLRACRQLGIPFVGVGPRRDKLLAAGAPHVLADLDPEEFLRVCSLVRGI